MGKKNVLKGICFVVVFVILFGIFSAVFMPKWSFARSDETQTRIQAFYRQEKNSHDVIYVGASFAYCAISPVMYLQEPGRKYG